MKKNTSHFLYKWFYILLILFGITYLTFKFVQSYSESLFVHKGDRINFIIYGPKTAFYSFDKNDSRHYIMYFYPDLKMQVPGGYGDYKVGSLGKLAKLDKNPELLRKTFAFATTSFVDKYFYPHNENVYSGTDIATQAARPSITDIIMLTSNASILDRVYLTIVLLDKKADDFHLIAYQSDKDNVHNDSFFEEQSFIKNSIGLLFQKVYRDEQKNVQLQYIKNYAVAEKISTVLEGNGIRVNDITLDMSRSKKCKVIEDSVEHSQTAIDLSTYFHCALEKGKTDVYDIIFVLSNLEKDWEV